MTSNRSYFVFTAIFLLLSLLGGLYLVSQPQDPGRQASPPTSITVTSQSGQGKFKVVSFDAYPEGNDEPEFPGQCNGVSASKCRLDLYSVQDGWNSLNHDDSSWQSAYSVVTPWWNQADWTCHQQLTANGAQIVSFKQPSDNKFKDVNDKTGLYRQQFTLPNDFSLVSAQLKIFSDNKTAVYINGHLISTRFSELCSTHDINIGYFQPGQNVIAIQLSNDSVSNDDNPVGLAFTLDLSAQALSTPQPTDSPLPEITCQSGLPPVYTTVDQYFYHNQQADFANPQPGMNLDYIVLDAHDHTTDFDVTATFSPGSQVDTTSISTNSNYKDHCGETNNKIYPNHPHTDSDDVCYKITDPLDLNPCSQANSVNLKFVAGADDQNDPDTLDKVHTHLRRIAWCYCQTPTLTPTTTPAPSNTPTPTQTPSPIPTTPADLACQTCQVFDSNWQPLDLNTLLPNQTIYLAASSRSSAGLTATKGRFRFTINGQESNWQESTEANSRKEFYLEYTIPRAGNYQVDCQVYHPSTGWK